MKSMDSDFDGMLPWHMCRTYLERELQQVRQAMEDAVTDPEIYRLQGEAKRLRKCLNLPAAISATTQEDA